MAYYSKEVRRKLTPEEIKKNNDVYRSPVKREHFEKPKEKKEKMARKNPYDLEAWKAKNLK